MKKDEIIALLQQQISFLQEQLQEANRKANALLEEVTSLRNMLEHKSEEEARQKRIIKGLAKITQNKSEKQPSTPAPQDAAAGQSSGKKERARTNNGAKRKQHLEVEVVEEDVEPEDPRFDKEQARLYKTRDVIRYELIPMRFIKKIYHVRTYTQNDDFFSGKAPDVPFLNSKYDGHRKEDIILDYMKDYKGAFLSDGFSPYRKMAKWLLRLACFNVIKRKFIDCGDDFDAKVIVRLINHLYHQEHKHKIGEDGWTEHKRLDWKHQQREKRMNSYDKSNIDEKK